jgi:hypothetical protein
MTKINDMNSIKDRFENELNDDNVAPLDALTTAVRALKALGLSKFMACTMAAHWAVEAGFIDSEDEELAEKQAEEAVA